MGLHAVEYGYIEYDNPGIPGTFGTNNTLTVSFAFVIFAHMAYRTTSNLFLLRSPYGGWNQGCPVENRT